MTLRISLSVPLRLLPDFTIFARLLRPLSETDMMRDDGRRGAPQKPATPPAHNNTTTAAPFPFLHGRDHMRLRRAGRLFMPLSTRKVRSSHLCQAIILTRKHYHIFSFTALLKCLRARRRQDICTISPPGPLTDDILMMRHTTIFAAYAADLLRRHTLR